MSKWRAAGDGRAHALHRSDEGDSEILSDEPRPSLPSAAFAPDIERARLKAIVQRDLELANSLHADDFEFITPGGRVFSKERYLGDIGSGALNYVVFEPASDIAVREYGQAAVVRYQLPYELQIGAEVDTDLMWHTALYEFRDGRWQVVWSHTTRIKQ